MSRTMRIDIDNNNNEEFLKIIQLRDKINKSRYDLTLKIINDILQLKGDIEYVALTDCKWIYERNLTNEKKNRKILKKYKKDLEEELDITIKPETNFIGILRKILKSQGYKLRYYKSSQTYSIYRD